MPIGPFGEIIGTTGTLETLGATASHYKSKVIAPRNPKLLKGDEPVFKMKPSQFMFQMSMNTEQKLANMHTMKVPKKVQLLDMADTSYQKPRTAGDMKREKTTVVGIDEPMFQPFPSEVIFQNFEPFESYEVPLLFRNNDKVPRLVKVTHEDSPYFKVISPHNVGHKVGPGLPTTFKIQFLPEEKKDYNHEVICVTEREKFVVPIRAIGARAILDFPDDVNFQPSPVKHLLTRTLLIRNIGNAEAKFSLTTEKPFTVTPNNGTLAVNDSIQVTVEFKPMTVGDHASELCLHYETGEDLFVNLYGAAHDANVRLDKNSIRIENTFISMANQRTVTISNRSDVIAHYHWTQFATQEEEDQQKLMFCDSLDYEENSERDRFLEECIQDPSLRDKMAIVTRTFQNRKKLLESDNMIFSDDTFRIEPMEGDIWPNSSAEVTVTFRPSEAEQYMSTAFCDVTGRESRLPLRLRGDGVGPHVQLSFDDLEMGNIFINSTHSYEIVLVNKGDIDAIFSILPSNSLFGPKFSFNPCEGILMPDGHQAIKVSFNSNILGDFEEYFYFQVDGLPEKPKLCLRGSCIGPTFHFDIPKLKFGTVSYGFPVTKTCTLYNTALVPMAFSLRVPGDGVLPSMNAAADLDDMSSVAGPQSRSLPPQEFIITPNTGTIPPQSQMKIEIQICSNTIKKYDLGMVVDVSGVGEEILSLPITARCIIPQITILTPILDFGRCFLHHPYEHHIKVQNESDLPAKYELVSQDFDELTPIIHSSPQMRGIIAPHAAHDVPLVITPQGLEELEILAQMQIFGSPEPPMTIQVTCIGEGPVVHIVPMNLDWGQVSVLAPHTQKLFLTNESLIPAKFTTRMVRNNSVWAVSPTNGEIAPEERMELTVTACLDDCIRFQDKVEISIINGPSRHIPVTGFGVGTTIVSDPPMCPSLNLGPNFSRRPCIRTFTLTNQGRRHQSLIWSSDGFPFHKRSSLRRSGTLAPLSSSKDGKIRDHLAPEEPSGPVFTLSPFRMELNPGDSIDITLEGLVETPQVIKEKLVCHAIIGKSGGKELIMKSAVTSNFITPLMETSNREITFRLDKLPEDELKILSKPLTLTNVSQLPLTTILDLNQPFAVVDPDDGETKNRTEIELGIGESKPISVLFNPAYKEDCHSRIAEESLQISYKEHPHLDEVKLKGEVNFPNLEFEKSVVDFGCILNDTEVTRYLNITNNSPMEVTYRWSFLVDGEAIVARQKSPESNAEEGEQFDERLSELGVETDLPVVEVDIQGAASPIVTPPNMQRSEKEELILAEKAEKEDGMEKCDAEKPVTPNLDQTELDGARVTPLDDAEHLNMDSRPSSPQLQTPIPPSVNPQLAAILQKDRAASPVGIEEIFDILPLYGTLKPGEAEQVTLTFFGHSDVMGQAKAICEVDGGPAYEIDLKGEASLVQYQFDCLEIDYGEQMYDQVAVAEIAIANTGKVGFEFAGIDVDPGLSPRPKGGIPIMVPQTGFIEANTQQIITIKYLAGVPEKFHKTFKIQVAHFEPDAVNLYGEGVFPRISLDLPRLGEDNYDELVAEAREILKAEKTNLLRPSTANSNVVPDSAVDAESTDTDPSELELQMEVERLVVTRFAEEQNSEQKKPDVLLVHSTAPTASTATKKKKSRKPKPKLPEYLLDLGHVVLGTVRSHVVRATNTGWFPVSFAIQKDVLNQYGLHVELDRVKQLPGAPDHETVDIVVTFDPRGANLGLEGVEASIPINIVGGPQVNIRVRANVTMPDMRISTDVVDFDEVKCGECKVVTVQLHNHQHVRCDWTAVLANKNEKKIDKHMPMHLRRKQKRERPRPQTFEMMPPSGILLPGQRVNVQVKFMPMEEKYYDNQISIRLSQSSQRILLVCRGQGLEPQLEFDNHLVEFGPILPHSNGDEKEIVIQNPCKFPLEIYNLEFDRSYLEEEKILRLMKGYDEYNTLLLPPRDPGDKLPTELMDYYEEQLKKFEEMETARREAERAAEKAQQDAQEERDGDEDADKRSTGSQSKVAEVPLVATTAPSRASEEVDAKTEKSGADAGGSEMAKDVKSKEESKSGAKDDLAKVEDVPSGVDDTKNEDGEGVGDLEITPVSAAIARHLGIDLTPEGKAARNRRGIAIIVHGAPKSGKSSAATRIAKQYEAALLHVDTVVKEAIANCNTPAGKKARELCGEAAKRRMEELDAIKGEDGVKVPGLSVEAVNAHTMGSGQIAVAHSVAQSWTSNRKTSTISDQKGKDKTSTVGGKTGVGASTGESHMPGSPPPLGPVAQHLNIAGSETGQEAFISTVLPEDVLVDVLSDRMRLSDCQKGVVFDGLETLFAFSQVDAARSILKAFNNRKYIYFVTMKLSYDSFKENEKRTKEEKEKADLAKEEAERLRFEEMDEDEYDALPDYQKAVIDKKRLETKKERLKRENEEKERERERRQKEAQEAELRKQEEENSRKKKKKGGDDKATPKDGKKSIVPGAKNSDLKATTKQEGRKDGEVAKSNSGTERPESHATERMDSAHEMETKKKKDKGGKNAPPVEVKPEEEVPAICEEELLLQQRFKIFEYYSPQMQEITDRWERATLCIRPVTPPEGQGENQEEQVQNHPQSGKKAKKERKDTKTKEAAKDPELLKPGADKAADVSDGASSELTPEQTLTEEEKKEKRLEDGIGIQHIMVDCDTALLDPQSVPEPAQQLMSSPKLPTAKEVLDGLGLGPQGPPMPPPAVFSVIPYPAKRQAPPGAEQPHYSFMATSVDDPNAGNEDKATEPEEEEKDTESKKEEPIPKSGKGKDRKEKRKVSPRGRAGTGMRSSVTSSPPPGASTPASEAEGSLITTDGVVEPKNLKLSVFRWTIPAQGEVTIKLKFVSEELGQFDQTLNFEIVGTRRRYQLYCRGVCSFPTISREPRIVFPSRKKTKNADEIIHKKYILTSETYEFGPLLVGKSRDHYKEGKYPENMEKLRISNTSPLESEITFGFLNDSKADTFLLEPPAMVLQPGESQELTIWAYPKVPGTYEDSLVCCVKENPEPVIFKLLCYGVRPELELDKKALHFDKVLLHRKDNKTLFLRNSTLLPVAWRLNGLDNLGDDFSVSQETGIIDPKSEFGLNFYFRAMKPVVTNKKSVRLEVMDVDNIMGLVQSDNISIHAEAYDVALDMSFAKGAEGGGIDFEVIRVGEEVKQQCTLKNKGKYEIEFSFVLEPTDICPKEVCDMLTVTPSHGTLGPVDRPLQVSVVFKSDKEVTVKEQSILRCFLVEPNMGDGEKIASIPIKVSVRTVFSKFHIFPVNDINFGPMMVNSKKVKTFTVENKGEFDFKYSITKMVAVAQAATKGRGKQIKSRDGSSSGRSRPRRTESIRPDFGGAQQKLILGVYTVNPAFSPIPAGGQVNVTVECHTETPGVFEEQLAIEITGRDSGNASSGLPYRLFAEGCVPAINVSDIGSVMEEHRIVRNLTAYQLNNQQPEAGGMFGEEENRFMFSNVLVGTKSQARFKISNVSKIPCDVLFVIKPTNSKHPGKFTDVFEVEPSRAQIACHSHIYATVTFVPPSMQSFSAIFEASIEVSTPSQAKGRNLTFELAGEGNLPRISILKPAVRNKKGQPLLLFKKSLIGRTQTLPLVISNDGNLASKVDIDTVDPDGVFQVSPTGQTQAVIAEMDIDSEGKKKPHAASVIVNVGESATFEVSCTPSEARRSQAHVRLTVVNNQYEDSVIQMVGEGYIDDVTLENIHSIPEAVDPEQEEGALANDDIPAAKSNHINFGDCNIKELRTLTFSMTNHSPTDCMRFQWPDDGKLKFTPSVGHLRPKSSKDFSVAFKADAPTKLAQSTVVCKVVRITFPQQGGDVPDWDDRLRTVKWVDIDPAPPASESGAAQPSAPGKPGTPQPPATAGPPTSSRPQKKKVIETEPEPSYQEMSDSGRTVGLLVSANADYCKAKCKTEAVHFRDTLMFQTRVFEFPLTNKGTTAMDFNWQVVMDNFVSPGPRSVTFAADEQETPRPGTANALAVRPESGVRPDSVVSSVISDTAYVPFSVEPESGTVLPGKKANISVKFSPLDVQEYEGRLICSIPNLEDGKQGPVVGLKGRSLMPYCHFELKDSDYISAARRNPELRGPGGAPPGTMLDPNTRVMEFDNVGTSIKNMRRFNVINPTNQRYTFKWISEDEINPKALPDFTCLLTEGEIKPGKKAEMGFEFVSSQVGLVESFWRFLIPELNISVPFLLAGNTTDPRVTLDRSHLNFKSLLTGHQAVEEVLLINNEDMSFSFAFKETSLYSPGFASSLRVEPLSGIVPPKTKLPLKIFFTPKSDTEVNFNVVCEVKRKALPLTLNVKAEGYSMDCLLIYEDLAGNRVDLTSEGFNEINFGEVEIHERAIRNFYIVNSGKFNFDYTWEFSDMNARKDEILTVTPVMGAVPFGDRVNCQVAFCPPARTSLRGSELTLKISNGPTYYMRLTGHGVPPGIHFSLNSYDFGPSFIIKPGMPEKLVNTCQLLVTNRDHKDISLDCLYQPSAHLHHDFSAQVIAPGQCVPVFFKFFPRDPVKYQETVEFEVNGISKQILNLTGQGTEMKVEVVDSRNKIVKLGALRIGQMVKKSIPIVNNSPAPVTFTVGMIPACELIIDPKIFKISHTRQEITLQPKGSAKVDLSFMPTSRIPTFTEEVLMECTGLSQPLFVVTGSCQGIDISLDTNSIPFGSVVQKSSSVRKVVMTNSGDIGAKFKWDIHKFLPDFSVAPVEGYIAAGMEVPFEVTFHPQEIAQDIRYENLKCQIEDSKPLKLTLTGMCNSQPSSKENVNFTTLVRQKETRNLMIANRTNQLWRLRPVIDGEHWSGAETIVVEPQQNKAYELIYNPMSMTSDGKKHTGSVFFPLPDGGGLAYNLSGSADHPKANGKISRDVPCKMPYTEMLSVNNWLKKQQRFKVKIEMMKPDKLDPGTTIKHLDYIDVPGNASRDYKITFHAHKDGISQFKMIFMNETTGEYQFYEMNMRAGRPGVIAAIDLVTPVRRTVSHTITLENPLTYPVTFSATCNVSEVLMPSQLQVPAQSEGSFNIDYLPLKVGDGLGRLEFNCNDLGLYMYDLNLKATTAGPERALYFKTALGSGYVQIAKFLNFAKQKTDYTCKIDNPDFHVDKSVPAAPGSATGTEVAVEITYEPGKIGETRALLTLSSSIGGDYVFPLFGTCTPPKPQGPYVIRPGTTTPIIFRNVFPHSTAFVFQVDNPLFHVNKQGETIKSRKDHRIIVGFDGNDSTSKAAVMGKLMISCAKSAGGQTNAQWVYYLKGVTPESK